MSEPDYAAYMICTSPRSGSTLLCKLLAATGVAGKPGSLFHEPSLSEWLDYYGLQNDQASSEANLLEAVFEAALNKGRGGTPLFGLRMQRRSFPYFCTQLKKLHPGLRDDVRRIEAAFGRTLFIHLTREDKLAQAVSFVKADQSGLWHKAPDGRELERLSEHREPVYDAALIGRQMNEMTAYDRDWEAWFRSQGLEPLRITYDALSRDPEAQLLRLFKRLKLDPDAAKGIAPPVARLSDAVNRDWMERYRAEEGR